MGAQPKAPATAYVVGIAMPLDRLIAEAPDRILGPTASARFGGRLSYLFKVLDVASMLSIQVHPTKEQAAAGFETRARAWRQLKALPPATWLASVGVAAGYAKCRDKSK